MVTCPVIKTQVLWPVRSAAHRTCGEVRKTASFEPSDADIRRHLQIVSVRERDEPPASGESA